MYVNAHFCLHYYHQYQFSPKNYEDNNFRNCCFYYLLPQLVNRKKKAPPKKSTLLSTNLTSPQGYQTKRNKKVCGALSFPTSFNESRACVCSGVELPQVTGLRFNFGSHSGTLDECAALFDSISILPV